MDYAGLLVGLGNPGQRYAGTRHNCGFDFVDALLEYAGKAGQVMELNGKKFNSLLWRISLSDVRGEWLVAKPQTFMNDSGVAVQPLLAWHNIAPDQMVVVQDELDIPPGELRFKFGGGLAGHNGLASIAERTGTRDFYRLRIGIGKPEHREDVIGWVLARPAVADREKIRQIMSAALETFLIFVRKGFHEAMLFARKAGSDTK